LYIPTNERAESGLWRWSRPQRDHVPERLDQVPHWPVRFPRGSLIYNQGEIRDALYRVDRGCVRLQLNGASGVRQVVAFLFPGELFGLSIEPQPCAAEACTDVILSRFQRASLMAAAASEPELLLTCMERCAAPYRRLARHLKDVVHVPARQRVLEFFERLSSQIAGEDGKFELPMTQVDASDFLGLSPETFSRVLADLRSEGLLHRDPSGRFQIKEFGH